MATESELLKRELDELKGKLRLSEMQCQELERKSSESTKIVVHSFKDRKINKFTKDKDVEEWINTIQTYINSKSE